MANNIFGVSVAHAFLTALIIYMAAINAAAFAAMGADKAKAVKNKRRISEKALFTLAFLGGGPGALLGMAAFRHKTRHRSFTAGMPLITVLNAGLCLIILWFARQLFM